MTRVDRLIAALASVNAAISHWARNLSAALLAAMTIVVLVQIGSRALLSVSLTWSEELARIMLVWSAFLIAPYAYRMGANVSIDLFVNALPRRLRLALLFAVNLLVVLIAGVFFVESLGFWTRGLNMVSATMQVRMAWFYSVVPFGFAGLVLVGAEILLRLARNFADPQGDYSVPGAVRLVPLE
jgi:TRAP-type C4-dicarboxylate transport system permease small subunit